MIKILSHENLIEFVVQSPVNSPQPRFQLMGLLKCGHFLQCHGEDCTKALSARLED